LPNCWIRQPHGCEALEVISTDDCLWFIGQALDGMVAIVEELGDEYASKRPEVPGSNSPYALLTHCLGVMSYWGGHVIAGRDVDRDRDAEFVASGAVEPLVERTDRAKRQLRSNVAGFEPFAPPLRRPDSQFVPDGESDADLPLGRTQGGALLHILQELVQHYGHMEITRDLLRLDHATTSN
jgi:hypothetical protein